MIDRLVLFEFLGNALWGDDSSDNSDYRSFAFSFLLAPNGWSLDPAIMAEYLEAAPEQFSSTSEALAFCARFVKSEIDNWGITDGQKVVDYFERLAADPSRTDVPSSYVALVKELEAA